MWNNFYWKVPKTHLHSFLCCMATLKWMGGAETRLCQNSHPWNGGTNREGSHRFGASPWGMRGFVYPKPLGLHQKDEASRMSGFGNQWGLYPGDPTFWGFLRHSFGGFACGLTCPGHQHNGSSLKGNWILCKDDSVANLKVSARRAGLAGISSGTEVLKSLSFAPFCTLLM